MLHFIKKERRYGCLTGMLLVGVNVLLWRAAPAQRSFLGAQGALLYLLMAVCGAFALLALLSLGVKLTHWRSYGATVMKRPAVVTLTGWLYTLVLAAFAVTVCDRVVLKLISIVGGAMVADTKPQSFFASMVYMFWKGRSMFGYGVWTTVRIALIGTAVAFVLAIFLTFLRIQTVGRRDGDLTRFCKCAGRSFAKVYITVIRGTPMMVQALIFYYAGFAAFKSSGMTVTEINGVWSFFASGLMTVSLNSTAYLAEVLRGGIEAIDAGQTEAARSLGMTEWQTMRRVIFPQAVKNSVPAIGNEFIINIKDSSVLSVIGVFDLMYATTSVNGIYYASLAVYCIAAVIYLALTCLSSLLMRVVAKKLDTPVRGVPSSN